MSRFFATVVLTLTLAAAAAAQRHRLSSINAETPEGALLQHIGLEQDAIKKLALLEEFASKYPKHDGTGWVLSQLQAEYLKAGSVDKALAAGEQLIALDAGDLDAAYTSLKAAEKKGDADAVIRWSAATSAAARKTAAAPKAADEEEEQHAKAVEYAKQIDTYSEYALFAAAVRTSDPARVMALSDALEQHNPASQYMPQLLPKYAVAARQASQLDKGAAFGERALARKQADIDLLLLMTEAAMNKQQNDKVQSYSAQLVALAGAQSKPEGAADADWRKKKDATLGAAYWFQGVAFANQSNFAASDKAFRSALPLLRDNEYLLAGATFYLGLANYKLAQSTKNNKLVIDALRFSQQSAAIRSPFQAQAAKNVKVIQSEYRVK